jgi:hypothetical protein
VANVEVLSHWYQLVDGLAYSSHDFYAALGEAIRKRGIPDAEVSEAEHVESSIVSGKRLYLRVKRKGLTFDICAAPFGRGFFVSWWLVKLLGAGFFPAVCLIIGGSIAVVILTKMAGLVGGLLLAVLIVPIGLMGLGHVVREGFLDIEDDVLSIPIIGFLYNKIFKPFTYYRADTTLMFQSAVHAAVIEVLDGITTAKGMRALSDLERKPVLREFYSQ